MTAIPLPLPTVRRQVMRATLVTALVTGVWDFACATALSVFAYGSTFSRLWQGVAATALGRNGLTTTRGVAAGIAVHLIVAFAWSTLFVFAAASSQTLRRALTTPLGAATVAILYGPIIWLVMSLGIIPFATGKLPTFAFRWWVQLFAHIPFVTIPLVFTARRMLGLDSERRD